MTVDRVIESSRDVLSGTPVFKGTRVPVQTLIDYLEAGDSLDDFLTDFPTVSRMLGVGRVGHLPLILALLEIRLFFSLR